MTIELSSPASQGQRELSPALANVNVSAPISAPQRSQTEAIGTEGLTKFYGPSRGIEGLDLTVYEGEVFGFLGPNGAGKTTTIRILMDLIRPTGGRACIFGMNVRERSLELKRVVGYLPGELSLWGNMTGRQTLYYLASVRGGVDMSFVWQLAERFGLDLDRKFREYSRGNKQKVGLVQAFMHRPRLLILDEPTSGLDPLNQQEFFKMVAEAQTQGATVFLSSHILSEVEQTSDRVGIVREGRLVRVGPVRDIAAERTYRMALTLAAPATPGTEGLFTSLPGVSDVSLGAGGLEVAFTVRGPVDQALKQAAQLPVVSITSREPSLEEAFLKYYSPGEESEIRNQKSVGSKH